MRRKKFSFLKTSIFTTFVYTKSHKKVYYFEENKASIYSEVEESVSTKKTVAECFNYKWKVSEYTYINLVTIGPGSSKLSKHFESIA